MLSEGSEKSLCLLDVICSCSYRILSLGFKFWSRDPRHSATWWTAVTLKHNSVHFLKPYHVTMYLKWSLFFLDWLVQGSKSTPKGNDRKLLCNWCLFRKKPDKQMSSERHMPHRVAKSARGLSYKLLVRCGSQVRQWQMAYNIHCRDAFVHGNLPGFSWLSKNQKKKKKKLT